MLAQRCGAGAATPGLQPCPRDISAPACGTGSVASRPREAILPLRRVSRDPAFEPVPAARAATLLLGCRGPRPQRGTSSHPCEAGALSQRVPACMLCGRADADPNICGPRHGRNGLCAHTFCLFLANGLYRLGTLQDGILGVLLEDIQHTIKRASQKQCFVCGERGATITCTETGCERSFHLPCASEGECVTQFFGQHRSFCWEHRPQQAVQAAPEQDTICIICMDPVGDSKSYHTMVCPACSHAWFHRGCIQGQAVSAGILCFQCPICRNKVEFRSEMSIMGIQIPFRGPTWEDGNAFASLQERHQRCDVSECLYPQGREQAEGQGPWQLLLGRSCAAEGTHRRCSNLTNSTGTWECDSCAGLGTASSTNLGLAGPSTSSPEALGPSRGSPAPARSSLSSTSSQAAPGPSHSSQETERRRPGTEQGTICQPVHQAQDTWHSPRRRRRSSRAAEPSAGSSTPSLASRRAPGTSSHSLVPEGRLPAGQRGRPRTRSLESRWNVQPQMPRASPEDAAGAATHHKTVLGAAAAPDLPGGRHRGPPVDPQGLNGDDAPASRGQPREEAAPHYNIRLQIPRGRPEDGVGADTTLE